MAAILLDKNQPITETVLHDIFTDCHRHLPYYACPIFLRFVDEIAMTQTMKYRKVDLVRDGIDVSRIKDPLYVVDVRNEGYQRLTDANYTTVLHSKL